MAAPSNECFAPTDGCLFFLRRPACVFFWPRLQQVKVEIALGFEVPLYRLERPEAPQEVQEEAQEPLPGLVLPVILGPRKTQKGENERAETYVFWE